jgi:hypothetical protein
MMLGKMRSCGRQRDGTSVKSRSRTSGSSTSRLFLDHRSLNIYTMMVSSILYFQRNTTGAALISSKYW